MRIKYIFLALSVFALTAISCKDNQKKKADSSQSEETDQLEEETNNSAEDAVYEAELSALNADITGGETSGKARFEIKGDIMKVNIKVKNAPAGIEHWQHFHGFADGSDATCPTADDDANDDGIVDLIETEKKSGTTMVPFNDLPAKMDIPTDTYPVADEDGNYEYKMEVKMNDLAEAFGDAFDGSSIDLDKRVLFIHGVAEDTELPETVQSLGPIPASTTLPIACGKITKIQ